MRSAVILAGGNSRRLGAEKSLLEFERKPLICWTVEKLSRAADEMVVVARSEAHAERLEKIISDFAPAEAESHLHLGQRGGIWAGGGPVCRDEGSAAAVLPSPRDATCLF